MPKFKVEYLRNITERCKGFIEADDLTDAYDAYEGGDVEVEVVGSDLKSEFCVEITEVFSDDPA